MDDRVDYIQRTAEQYSTLGYDAYRWFRAETEPAFVPIVKPLADTKLAVLASGGVYRHGQIAFHWKDDTSIRRIPADVDVTELRATHFAYDLQPARTDPNVVFPIDTVRDLVADGIVGAIADDLITFMGGIYSTRRVEAELIPHVVDAIDALEVDLVLLVPV